MKFCALIFFGFMASTVFCQHESTNSGIVVHLDFGLAFSGPSQQMKNHMIEHDFDRTTQFFGRVEHPKIDIIGPSLGLGLTKAISASSNIGLSLQYSYLREVSGASQENFNLLFISFNSYQLIPSYAKTVGDFAEFRLGLPLMVNSSKKVSRSGRDFSYKNLGVGLLLGLNFKFYEGNRIIWKIGTDAIITHNSQIGYFTAGSINESILPKSQLNFSHINLKFIMGIKTGKN